MCTDISEERTGLNAGYTEELGGFVQKELMLKWSDHEEEKGTMLVWE